MVSDLLAARMADAAYGRLHGALPPVIWFHNTTEYVEIRDDGATLFIVIRGTDEKLRPSSVDWRRNLNIRFMEPEPLRRFADSDGKHKMLHGSVGKLHAGFVRASLEVVVPIKRTLKRYNKRPLVLIGHSHGGPMACILADLLAQYGWHVRQVVTFGCPNFCDKAWAKAQKGIPTEHFVHGRWPLWRDPVAYYPLRMRRSGKTTIKPAKLGAVRNHVMSSYIETAETV